MMAVVSADVKNGAGAGLAPLSVRSRKLTLQVRILHVSASWRIAKIVCTIFSMVLGASVPIKSVANCWSVGTSSGPWSGAEGAHLDSRIGLYAHPGVLSSPGAQPLQKLFPWSL